MRVHRYIALCLGLAAGVRAPSASAQQVVQGPPPIEPQRQRLVSVRIEPSLHGEDPWSRVALSRGVLVDDDVLRVAVDRAVASGTFGDLRAAVRAVDGGIELVLRGERRTRMVELRFDGVD